LCTPKSVYNSHYISKNDIKAVNFAKTFSLRSYSTIRYPTRTFIGGGFLKPLNKHAPFDNVEKSQISLRTLATTSEVSNPSIYTSSHRYEILAEELQERYFNIRWKYKVERYVLEI
jgi:hypothetical protein